MYPSAFRIQCTTKSHIFKLPKMPTQTITLPSQKKTDPLKDTSIKRPISPSAIHPYRTIFITDVEPGFICEHHSFRVYASEPNMTATPVHSGSLMSASLSKMVGKLLKQSNGTLICVVNMHMQNVKTTDGKHILLWLNQHSIG